jgi:hypothetical protein
MTDWGETMLDQSHAAIADWGETMLDQSHAAAVRADNFKRNGPN